MDGELIRVTPDIEKAKSILKMVETTIEMIQQIDVCRFSSNVIKEYYEVIRELITVVVLLDGYKTYGEGSHKKLIEYLGEKYNDFSSYEISLIDELRNIRNKIAYDGFFVEKDYVERKMKDIFAVIKKLRKIIKNKV